MILNANELDFSSTFVELIKNLLDNSKNSATSSCIHHFFITDNILHNNSHIAVPVLWPTSETLIVEHIPDQELINFTVYVCSWVRICFGLSAYSVHNFTMSVIGKHSNNFTLLAPIEPQFNLKEMRNVLKFKFIKLKIDEPSIKVEQLKSVNR